MVATLETLVDRHCPNCGTAATSAVVMRADQPAESLGQLELTDHWRGFHPTSCFFSYARCSTCGQLFSPHYFSETMLASLYASMGDNIHSGDMTSSVSTQIDYVKTISHYTQSAKHYLEIGPDTGILSRAVNDRFGVEAAFLVEPNRTVWSQLTKTFPDGVAKISPNIGELDEQIPDGTIDLAVAVHVLDHLLEPLAMLRLISRKLTRRGVLVVVVHNERSFLARLLGRRWPAYCLQHPQLFNVSTLASIIKRDRLSVKAVLPTVNYFPLGYLASHALLAGLRLKIDLRFLRWPIRLHLGNFMVIAIKECET